MKPGGVVDLPRLLYVGDVADEPPHALHRLLQHYPRDRFRSAKSNFTAGRRVVAGPANHYYRLAPAWPLNTRLSKPYAAWLCRRAGQRVRAVQAGLDGFIPEAILTVLHGFAWITALAAARSYRVPLHVIAHDDWVMTRRPLPSWSTRSADGLLADAYQFATSRLCVSQRMADVYAERYGVSGEVLLPSRAADGVVFADPPTEDSDRPPVLAYAGAIYPSGYACGIVAAAAALRKIGGRVLVYSAMSSEALQRAGLVAANIEVRPPLPTSNDLIVSLRREATAVLTTMAFEHQHRTWMETSFPSKLTDYTSTGLPQIVCAPAYSSVAGFALEHPDAFLLVSRADAASFEPVLQLLRDPSARYKMAREAIRVGRSHFGYEQSVRQFHEALLQRAGTPTRSIDN